MSVTVFVRGTNTLYPIYSGYMTRESAKSIEKDTMFLVVENKEETITKYNVSRETYIA